MRKLICLSISFLALSVFCLFAQGELKQGEQKSLVEQTEESKGGLIKKEKFSRIVYSGWTSVFHMLPSTITDLKSGHKLAYISIDIYINGVGYHGIIEFEEIPAILQAFEGIISSEINTTPSSYTTVFYQTKNGIEIGAFYNAFSEKKKNWSMYITNNRYVSKPQAVNTIETFKKFIDDLKSAQTLLQEHLNN